MGRLVDDMAEALERTRRFQLNVLNPLLIRYYERKQLEAEEAKLSEENLIDEPSDYTALSPEYEHA